MSYTGPTTEMRGRTFKDFEKWNLYNRLRKPYSEKMESIISSFISFLEDNVLGKVLDPDFLELGVKPYCYRSISSFIISPDPFRLEKEYVGKPDYSKCSYTLSFQFSSKKYRYATSSKIFTIDISEMILEKCPTEIIEQIKYSLVEIAKARYDFNYYGLGTFVYPKNVSYQRSGIFSNLKTWGNLYSNSPEMYEVLYEMVEGKKPKDKEMLPELKLLNELKFALGY